MKHSEPAAESKRQRRLCALRRQIERLDRILAELEQQSRRLVRWRLISFVLLLVAGAAVLLTWGPIPWLIASLLLLLVFVVMVYWHRQVEASSLCIRIWRQLKLVQLARMMLDWENIPPTEPVDERFEHPFGRDLELIGSRSVHRLLDLSITIEGSRLLRDWLLEFEPNLAELRNRQTVVRELVRIPALSSRLVLSALLAGIHGGADALDRGLEDKWSGDQLLQWLDLRPESHYLRPAFVLLVILAPINILLLLGYLQGSLPPIFVVSWLLYAAVTASQIRVVEPVFRDTATISDSLRQLGAVFSCLEERSFKRFPALHDLTQPLRQRGQSPSELIGRTNRLLAAAGLRYNPMIALVMNAIFPLDLLVADRLEALKSELLEVLPGWLDIWYELEALGSLANFAYLYPEASFPEIEAVEESAGMSAGQSREPFYARCLGHPLIIAEDRANNDFSIDQLGTLVIITGSNMAGKSTFLRTLGINIRLALTGAPVLAQELRTLPFRIFASITVMDSLTNGFSFFYVEVRRLKALLDLLQEPDAAPIFFLIDEIFRGTNNRERLIGSRSYVASLVGGNGCGVIATHDLELVQLEKDGRAIVNAHFRDDVLDGRMVFDYKLHPGPCPTTNALRIMKLAGLPVDLDNEAN